MNENTPKPTELVLLPLLREDVPAPYPHIKELVQNAPILQDGCPAVPLVMEDV